MTGKNTIVRGKNVFIDDNVSIGDNTSVIASRIRIGFGSRIEENCRILPSGNDSVFSLGDNCVIGHDSKIVVPVFETGDYVTLNNHLLVNGYKPCTLGHNIWIGQNCILNATDTLTIGNGVGIGAYSSVWTHGAFGELLEGCTLFKVAPVVIEDNVWIVGCYNVISPGIRLGKRSVVLTGSVVTKDVAPNACVAGNPAKDITEKVQPYRTVTLTEKYDMIQEFVRQFVETHHKNTAKETENGWRIKDGRNECEIVFVQEANNRNVIDDGTAKIVFTKKNKTNNDYRRVTIFDLSTKTYTKRKTDIEISVMRFLLGHRARFLPSARDKTVQSHNIVRSPRQMST
jgi:acetyltransferase-like isoleucine patch superfamily enzyme